MKNNIIKTLERIKKDIRYKRLLMCLAAFIIVVAAVAFLNFQMDDEIQIGFYDYLGYPENADFEGGICTVDESTGLSAGDTIAETPAMHLDKGDFIISVDHQNDNDFTGVLYEDGKEIDRFILPADDLNTRYRYHSDINLYEFKVSFLYNGNGRVSLKKSVFYSEDGAFYYDTLIYAFLIILCACVIVYTMIRTDFFDLPLRDKFFYGFMFAFLILCNYPFFRPFDTVARGDKGYHMSQAEGIYRGLLDGQMPAILYTDVMHGRGMIGALYPHLLYTVPALFRMLHISVEGSFRLFLILINLFTCLSAFCSSNMIIKNRLLSLMGMAMFFMLPYRLSAITLRSAYGEAVALIFVPLLIAGMYEIIFGNEKHWPVLSIGLAGIIVTHLGTALQMAEVCMITAVVFFVVLIKKKRIRFVLYAIVTALMIDLWFIYSFLYYYNSDLDISGQTMGDLPYITYYFSQMMQLLPNTTPGRQYNHQVETIGIWLILIFILAIYMQFSKKDREARDNYAAFLLALGMLFIFAASKSFPWSTLSKFERIYSFATLMEFSARYYLMGQSLMVFGSLITISIWKTSRIRLARTIYVAIFGVAILQSYLILDSYLITLPAFTDVREYRYTADTNDMLDYDFFVPYGYDHESFPSDYSSPAAVISGYWHRDSHTGFSYVSQKNTFVEVPLTYYEGFKAILVDSNEELTVEKGDKGCIRIALPQSDDLRRVRLDFIGYPFKWTTVMISILSILALIVYIVIRNRKSHEDEGTLIQKEGFQNI